MSFEAHQPERLEAFNLLMLEIVRNTITDKCSKTSPFPPVLSASVPRHILGAKFRNW